MTTSLLRVAYNLFGISLIAFGIQQWISGQIVIGRPPAWPTFIPAEFIVAYLLGAWLVFNGISIFINRYVWSLTATAWFILVWCAARNLFVVIFNGDIGGSLTNFGKGITLAGGLLLVAATMQYEFGRNESQKPANTFFVVVGLYCIALFLFASGIQHFIYADFVKFLIPAWIPFPVFWTYAAGVALAVAGLTLAIGIKRQLIAQLASIMIFSWVIVLHIPLVLKNINSLNEWTAVFEALAFSSILFIIANASSIAPILNTRRQYEFAGNK
jgi:uncharacterized membrane protein YphA (DoxX/SURF4 family)